MRYATAVLSVLVFVQTPSLAGEQFRCRQWVVSAQVSVVELLKKCGEPTTKTSTTQDVLVRNAKGYMMHNGVTVTEIWTYDRGSRALPMIVTIVDGQLKSMSHNP